MDEAQEQAIAAASAPQIRTSPYNNPLNNYGSSIIMLTNPEQELFKLELVLRGGRVSPNGQLESVGKHPLCNDIGVSSILGEVQAIVNQVTVFSNLNDAEVEGLRDFLADTLARDLMLNRKTYGITDPAARSKIMFAAISYAVVTISRGRGGDEKKFLSKSVQEISTNISQGSQRGGGLLSKLNPWNKQ